MVVIVEEHRFCDRCSKSRLLDMWLVCRFRGIAFCEPRRADVVTGAALCEPRSADFVAVVNLAVQILWRAQHW